MKWTDDYTDDVSRERSVWDQFAGAHGVACHLIRTHDHVYNRLQVIIPQSSFEVFFEAADKQTWHAGATGPATRVEAFGISPRTFVDNLLDLVQHDEARFQDPGLRRLLVISGPGGGKAGQILDDGAWAETLHNLGQFNLALSSTDHGFQLRLMPDPAHAFSDFAEPVLALLMGFVQSLREKGAIL